MLRLRWCGSCSSSRLSRWRLSLLLLILGLLLLHAQHALECLHLLLGRHAQCCQLWHQHCHDLLLLLL
jgi:hypothetical protein